MSALREADLVALQRRVCYLLSAPRQVYRFGLQRAAGVGVYAGTDWAGCAVTRRSIAGCCTVMGRT